MPKKQNNLGFISEESRAKCINEIVTFFKNERDEDIGIIAAGQVLDFFLQAIGEDIYKKAVGDCKKLIREKLEDLEVDLDILSPKNE
jgi:uncharacterized protein (DUF2164 family)